MEQQDRSLWDAAQIGAALDLLATVEVGNARSGANERGRFELEARIAAEHARAARADSTNWTRIAQLYAELKRLIPSPVIALNEAVTIAMSKGLEFGLAQIDALAASGELDGYYLLHAARADLLRRLQRNVEAAEAYRSALALVANQTERRYLEERLRALGPDA